MSCFGENSVQDPVKHWNKINEENQPKKTKEDWNSSQKQRGRIEANPAVCFRGGRNAAVSHLIQGNGTTAEDSHTLGLGRVRWEGLRRRCLRNLEAALLLLDQCFFKFKPQKPGDRLAGISQGQINNYCTSYKQSAKMAQALGWWGGAGGWGEELLNVVTAAWLIHRNKYKTLFQSGSSPKNAYTTATNLVLGK